MLESTPQKIIFTRFESGLTKDHCYWNKVISNPLHFCGASTSVRTSYWRTTTRYKSSQAFLQRFTAVAHNFWSDLLFCYYKNAWFDRLRRFEIHYICRYFFTTRCWKLTQGPEKENGHILFPSHFFLSQVKLLSIYGKGSSIWKRFWRPSSKLHSPENGFVILLLLVFLRLSFCVWLALKWGRDHLPKFWMTSENFGMLYWFGTKVH